MLRYFHKREWLQFALLFLRFFRIVVIICVHTVIVMLCCVNSFFCVCACVYRRFFCQKLLEFHWKLYEAEKGICSNFFNRLYGLMQKSIKMNAFFMVMMKWTIGIIHKIYVLFSPKCLHLLLSPNNIIKFSDNDNGSGKPWLNHIHNHLRRGKAERNYLMICWICLRTTMDWSFSFVSSVGRLVSQSVSQSVSVITCIQFAIILPLICIKYANLLTLIFKSTDSRKNLLNC